MQKFPEYDEPVSRFSIAVFRANGALLRNGDRLTKSIGQSSAQWHVMGQVEFSPSTVAQIARNMGQARQSVQRVADQLVSEGLAVYDEKPGDKRTKLLRLTARGEAVMHQIGAKQTSWTRMIAPQLGSERLLQAASLLEELAEILEQSDKEEKDHERSRPNQ